MGALPLFNAKNEPIFPVPVAGIPIDGFVFVQLNVDDVGFLTELLNITGTVLVRLQTI